MKFKSPNLSGLNKVKPSLTLLLTIVLLLVLLYEAYLAYQYIYLNLVFDFDQIVPTNIVRVDLSAYQDTMEFLDDQKNFTAAPLEMKRSNPFRP